MKKLLVTIFAIMLSLLPYTNVEAEEIYYTNDNGVSFTETEYNWFTEMFWDGYQKYVTVDEYNDINSHNLFGEPVYKKIYVEPVDFNDIYYTRGNPVTENLRTIGIAKSCNNGTCLLSLGNTWNGDPTVKSWDVFGARASNTTITSVNSALVTATNYSQPYSSPTISGGGFGYSVQVPNASNIIDSVSFYANTGGTIYGTYQHAMTTISESNSHLYNIVYYGYGGVFNFYGAAFGIYDGCNGVNISV